MNNSEPSDNSGPVTTNKLPTATVLPAALYGIPPPSRSIPPPKALAIPPPNFSVPPPNFSFPPPSLIDERPHRPRNHSYQSHSHPIFNHPPPPPPLEPQHKSLSGYPDENLHQRRRYSPPPKYFKREDSDREDDHRRSSRSSTGDRHRSFNAPKSYASHSNSRHIHDRKYYSDQPKFNDQSQRKRENSRFPSHELPRSSRRSPCREGAPTRRRNFSPHQRRGERSPSSGQRKRHSPSPKRRSPPRQRQRPRSRSGVQNKSQLPSEQANQEPSPEQVPVSTPPAAPPTRTRSETERDRLLNKWRSNFCETPDDIADKLAQLDSELENTCWIRSSPAEIYYNRTTANDVEALPRLEALCNLFEDALVKRTSAAVAQQQPYEPPCRKKRHRLCRHRCKLIFVHQFHIL